MHNNRKGFTLIELLVVIAIIGILAATVLIGLSSARQAGRDARRVADLRTVQQALELYFNKCGIYPGDSACVAGNDPAATLAGWTTLSGVLTGAGLGISVIPNDPIVTPGSTRSYIYAVKTAQSNSSSLLNQGYILRAELEISNKSLLTNDVDGSTILDCDDEFPSGALTNYYCVEI